MCSNSLNSLTNEIPNSMLHALLSILEEDPQRVALIYNNRKFTYLELAYQALQLQKKLERLGVQKGDHVAVLSTPRPEGLISLLAVWLIDATWVGVNTRYKFSERQQLLNNCKAQTLLWVSNSDSDSTESEVSQHAAYGVKCVELKSDQIREKTAHDADLVSDVLVSWRSILSICSFNNAAVIIYTSGSTGVPKGALITHEGLTFRSLSMALDRFNGERINLILDLPINHIGALATGIGLVWATGGTLILSEKFDAAFTIQTIEENQVNVIIGVPAMLSRLVEHKNFQNADLSSLKYVCWGAGPLSERVLQKILDCTNALISQQYGMTESNGAIVYTPPTRNIATLLSTTGRPDPRLLVRIADEYDTEVPTGIEGEVQVKQPYPFAGYLNDSLATARVLTSDGYLKTGDLAKLTPEGDLIFCGRSKEMFKSGGFNVYPREIEITLEEFPPIRAAAVLPQHDEVWGQIGVAFIEPNQNLVTKDIIDWCKKYLADFKIPKRFIVLDALPLTALGKVDRLKLANSLASRKNDYQNTR